MPLFGRAKQKLPFLSEYVARMAVRTPEGQAAQAAGCSLAVLMSGVGFIALERVFPLPLAVLVTLFVFLPLLASLSGVWIKYLSRPQTEEQQRRKEAQEAIAFMNSALQRGKLHRKIDRAVGLLLDECARHWLRIHDSLRGTFWEDKELSGHWKMVRDQSVAAANRAMDDAIVMLTPVLEARGKQTGAQELIGEVLESVLIMDTQGPIEPLPKGFQPARDVAQKLKELADEVEEAAGRAAKDLSFQEHFSSSTHIDQVLGDLRMIKQAESELHQELHQGDER